MKERLIEIFRKLNYQNRLNGMTANLATQFTDFALEQIVDKLLAEGVIVPPCKVGDTFFYIDAFNFEPCKKSGKDGDVCPYLYAEYGFGYECNKGRFGAKPRDCVEIKSRRIETLDELISLWDCFGESLFLTREEAERALERGAGNGS